MSFAFFMERCIIKVKKREKMPGDQRIQGGGSCVYY